MRRFLASAWFPLVTCLLMALAALGAYAGLPPGALDVSSKVADPVKMAAWGTGPVMAILSFLVIGILNLIRRLVRLRKVAILHPLVVIAGILPWLIFGWVLVMDEPRNTEFAIAVIDFIGRQMLVGSFFAIVFALLMLLVTFIPSKK